MKITSKERQRQWKQKKIKQGYTPMTIYLSQIAKAFVDTEKRKTGESISAVIDRVLCEVFMATSIKKPKVTTNKIAKKASNYRKDTPDMIVKLKDKDGLSDRKTALWLDSNGYPTKSGKPWSRGTINKIYRRAKGEL